MNPNTIVEILQEEEAGNDVSRYNDEIYEVVIDNDDYAAVGEHLLSKHEERHDLSNRWLFERGVHVCLPIRMERLLSEMKMRHYGTKATARYMFDLLEEQSKSYGYLFHCHLQNLYDPSNLLGSSELILMERQMAHLDTIITPPIIIQDARCTPQNPYGLSCVAIALKATLEGKTITKQEYGDSVFNRKKKVINPTAENWNSAKYVAQAYLDVMPLLSIELKLKATDKLKTMLLAFGQDIEDEELIEFLRKLRRNQ